MDFQELEKYNKKDTFFGAILNYLYSKYTLLADEVSVDDYYVQEDFHSISLQKESHFVNIEVHKNRIEIKVNFILFCLFFDDCSEKTIFEILDSVIKGKYEITEFKTKKGILRKLKIVWDSPELEALNREEKVSLKTNYEHQQRIRGINLII